jgi:hypothetical protein
LVHVTEPEELFFLPERCIPFGCIEGIGLNAATKRKKGKKQVRRLQVVQGKKGAFGGIEENERRRAKRERKKKMKKEKKLSHLPAQLVLDFLLQTTKVACNNHDGVGEVD